MGEHAFDIGVIFVFFISKFQLTCRCYHLIFQDCDVPKNYPLTRALEGELNSE